MLIVRTVTKHATWGWVVTISFNDVGPKKGEFIQTWGMTDFEAAAMQGYDFSEAKALDEDSETVLNFAHTHQMSQLGLEA